MKEGPDKITLEEKYGPIDFEKHVKSIKTKERLTNCSYCNKEYITDIPVGRRSEGDITGIYSCPYCNQNNVISISDPITTTLISQKHTHEDIYPKYEGRKQLISLRVAVKKGDI